MTNKSKSISPVSFNKPDSIKPADFTPLTGKDIRRRRKIRYTSVAIGLLLFACLGLAWFVFTAKSLSIDTEPEDAGISITTGLYLKFADSYLIRPGTYQLLIQAPGYYPLETHQKVTEAQNQHYTFSLRRLPGHLKVITRPQTDAEIWLDNELKGKAQHIITNLPHAIYTIRVIAERYLPFEDTIQIAGMDREQTLEVRLTPGWAEVSITSTPPEADIYIDDEVVGQTPLNVEIMQGAHNLRVKKSRYKTWQDDIKVTANEPMTINDIILEPADAVVKLETNPSRASVIIDGQYSGLTPLETALTPGKKVDIRFFKEGYQRTSRRITVSSGEEQHLVVDLTPELTDISINSIPSDAELYIDGRPQGRVGQTLKLPTRPHNIEIRREGYVSYTATITPRTGIDQNIQVTLKTLQQVKQEAIKPLIKSAAGQTLKLFYPGRFTMGASRREPGRRANETLRNIDLTRPFYLAIKETSNAEFRMFMKSHSSGDVKGENLDADLQPVVRISWQQAALYCNWLSKRESLQPFYLEQNGTVKGYDKNATGYRLPTEAEWAWAARAEGSGQMLKFPWGDGFPPTVKSGNYADVSAAHLLGRILPNYLDGYAATAPVGSYPPGSKGLYDMGGNVSEWINDYYDIAVGVSHRIEQDPMGPDTGEHHVIRGSSWAHGSITELRFSYRNYGSDGSDDLGFRIARFLDM
jgi:formylglycine-generating enzyme required for sulfatase activity